MKLQQKISLRFLLITLMIFVAAGASFYYLLSRVIDKNINDTLESRKDYAKAYLHEHDPVNTRIVSPDQTISINLVNQEKKFRHFTDTLIYDADEKEFVNHRKMTFITSINHRYYEVAIVQSLVESEDLLTAIFYFMVGLFVCVLLALFFVNRWLSATTWKPFFTSLEKLQTFKIGDHSTFRFDRTNIYEFDTLNDILEKMTRKMQTDFQNLREFSENASHEIQTPLAIIKSKLEMVLQDSSLTPAQHQKIYGAYDSASRLSKLNEALLLLSKIENQQFIEQSRVNFCELIESRLSLLEELFTLKKIELTVHLETPVIISINPMLGEILMNNLIGNALRHNVENGKISITSGDHSIVIANTGRPLTTEPSKLFQRFVKQTASGESTGLGLAIAHEICKTFNLGLQYSYETPWHTLTISF